MECKICAYTAKNFRSLSTHIKWKHPELTITDYYDNFLLKENEGICLSCGNRTSFKNINLGYNEYCSVKCMANSETVKLSKCITSREKYGVDNISQSEDIKKRKIETCLKNFSTDNPLKDSEIQSKQKNTVKRKYGVDNISQLDSCKVKKRETCLKNYGVEFPSQDKEILEKQNRKLRFTNEKNGRWIPDSLISDFLKYRKIVQKETKRWKTELFENWDGKDYYTGEMLVTNEEYRKEFPLKHLSSNPMQPTIDHMVSIFNGFYNEIDPVEIADIKNLCICSRKQNSKKQRRSV